MIMYLRTLPIALRWFPLVLLLSVWCTHAKKDTPRIGKQKFDANPFDIRYFEDSDTILAFVPDQRKLHISHDAGEEWKEAKGVDQETVIQFWMHPYDNQRAYAIGAHSTHWYTNDQGKSWNAFEVETGYSADSFRAPFSFHGTDSDKIVFNVMSCLTAFICKHSAYYTTDGFKTIQIMRENTLGCVFAHSTPLERNEGDHEERVLCIVPGTRGQYKPESQKLLYSDKYFKDGGDEPILDSENGRTVQGIISMAVVKGYIVAAQKSEGTSELALYVSTDGHAWNKARFPHTHKLQEKAYTVLESTNYSIQVDVMSDVDNSPMGTLFSSDSEGLEFTANIDHVNRNVWGIVDFEKVQGIQGIIMVNRVLNFEEVQSKRADKQLQSEISFDDGRTFDALTVIDKDGKKTDDKLHLHSVTQMSNSGLIFSSPAPGLVMGVGNTGKFLREYSEGDLYVSDDAGITWRLAIEDAHKYEFGDQGSILVAVNDEGATDEIKYSLNHGKDWETIQLDEKVKPRILTTVPDSTSLKFVMSALVGKEYYIYSIDFDGMHERNCKDDDFEDWVARKNEKGDADCLMGHTQTYRRRKPDADCFIGEEFKEAKVQNKDCECTKEDFECTTGFEKDGDECKLSESMELPKDQCGEGKESFTAKAYRKIPGDTCKDGATLDKEEKDYKCGDVKTPPAANGTIINALTEFKGKHFRQKVYLERGDSATGSDETVLLHTDEGEIYITKDHGKTWKKMNFGADPVVSIWPHQYNNDMVFFLTRTRKVYYSVNRGDIIKDFLAPHPPTTKPGLRAMNFHQDHSRSIIWTGDVDCEQGFRAPSCRHIASFSKDRGDSWQTLAEQCKKCEFIKRDGRGQDENLIYCEQHLAEDPSKPLQLISSNDFFDTTKDYPAFKDIVAFATMSEFIVVANKDPDEKLRIDASVDGHNFADAQFPKDFSVPHQTAYTLLDSSTHSVFLQVTESEVYGFEYGRLMKSNSNGTSYVLSIAGVNQNSKGYVDFEKMQGLEGVALVNVVDNTEGKLSNEKKKLKTMITHNDGAQWTRMKYVVDEKGQDFPECGARDPNCSLHIHGYTERADPSDTYSSPSAVGLMIGTGNVGPYLEYDNDKIDTFITSDGGIKWRRIMRGKYMWEYGDQGSIIVLVQDGGQTKEVQYSLDDGNTWMVHEFLDSKVTVNDLTTVPSDSSVNFLIWGKDENDKLITTNMDFSGLRERTCKLNEDESEDGDYEFWSPSHPMQPNTNCLFGHQSKYHRKKLDADCWNSRKIEKLHSVIEENCTCTRQDYECDYNYQLSNDDTCTLVPGLEAHNPEDECAANKDQISYRETQGYRRIPITTCDGGDAKYFGEEKPCPGHEEQLKKKRGGLSGFGLFIVAFVLPVTLAAGIGYWVYTRWDGKFGRIRLGDGGSAFDADQPWIRYPVAAVSGLVAVLAAFPLLISAAWRQLGFGGNRRFTTRESFARGRGDYAVVDADEDELLGEDDDEL